MIENNLQTEKTKTNDNTFVKVEPLVMLRRKEYRDKNRERINKWKREDYKKNKDKILQQQKRHRAEYRAQHPDKRKKEIRLSESPDYYKRYREENKEHLRTLAKEYYENNKTTIRERARKYYNENKENILAKSKDSTGAIKALIRGRGGFLKHSEIPKELVEIKKLQLQLKREMKNANKIIG